MVCTEQGKPQNNWVNDNGCTKQSKPQNNWVNDNGLYRTK
jgi:hypothetical protein